MLDTEETIKRFGYSPDALSRYSCKRVIRICIRCGDRAEIYKYNHRDEGTCLKCVGPIKAEQAHRKKAKGLNKRSPKFRCIGCGQIYSGLIGEKPPFFCGRGECQKRKIEGAKEKSKINALEEIAKELEKE